MGGESRRAYSRMSVWPENTRGPARVTTRRLCLAAQATQPRFLTN